MMRLVQIIPAALLMVFSSPISAQDWIEYVNLEDYFTVNFPGEPEIEEFTYISEYDSHVPARRYTALNGESRYMVTVVDMAPSSRPPGRKGTEWRGAIAYAATASRQTGEVTYDAYGETNVIPGHQLQINLPDGRRNFVQIHFHEKRLYILEAIAPLNLPPPALIQASFAITDAAGNRLRYLEEDHAFPDDRPLARRGDVTLVNSDNLISIGQGQDAPEPQD